MKFHRAGCTVHEFTNHGVLQALAIMRRRTFTLAEISPGSLLSKDSPDKQSLGSKEFLVPYGKLTAGRGRREAHSFTAAETSQVVEVFRKSIIVSSDFRDMETTLEIGFNGPGSKGKDSLIVLVEAATPHQAWAVSIQSKQHLAATSEYESCQDILQAMEGDLKETHRLPQLQGGWASWHNATSNDSKPLPDGPPSNELWNDSESDQRILYAYVTDGVFSRVQLALRQQLLARGHPWMSRVMIVSARDQQKWHLRAGALLRTLRHAALTQKDTCEDFFGESTLLLPQHNLQPGLASQN